MNIDVHITAEDIKNGTKESLTSCPVALALRRHGYDCEVGTEHLSLIIRNMEAGRKGKLQLPLPKKVRDFIYNFDFGTDSKPFRLRINRAKAMLMWRDPFNDMLRVGRVSAQELKEAYGICEDKEGN